MKQNKQLLIALEKAKDVGYLEDKNLQFRSYDYSEYYKSLGRAKKDPKPNHRSNSVVHRILNLDSQV
ncbi:hypothetical protein EB796_022846 [Bugula neritina]|uniref:Uncharacterized protein n=1 Tax=Bugula neritina TaxID=10212 RepID=A0A7J7IY99_BUGNE|nr:hypothetical protein EB796_022846 [Bugula neritina]